MFAVVVAPIHPQHRSGVVSSTLMTLFIVMHSEGTHTNTRARASARHMDRLVGAQSNCSAGDAIAISLASSGVVCEHTFWVDECIRSVLVVRGVAYVCMRGAARILIVFVERDKFCAATLSMARTAFELLMPFGIIPIYTHTRAHARTESF